MLLTFTYPVLSSSKRSNILFIPFYISKYKYSGLFVTQSCSDTVKELFKINVSTLCFQVCYHVENRWVFCLEPKTLHGRFELCWINFSRSLCIKEIESFSELLNFIFSKSRPFYFLLHTCFGSCRLSSHLSLFNILFIVQLICLKLNKIKIFDLQCGIFVLFYLIYSTYFSNLNCYSYLLLIFGINLTCFQEASEDLVVASAECRANNNQQVRKSKSTQLSITSCWVWTTRPPHSK